VKHDEQKIMPKIILKMQGEYSQTKVGHSTLNIANNLPWFFNNVIMMSQNNFMYNVRRYYDLILMHLELHF
jgi:hypothetical protein